MTKDVAIIGGSVAGLATGVALARRGWDVTIVERDPAPQTDNGDAAFTEWDRRYVPQFRQPHAFAARSRNLLLKYVPEVVERLVAEGIEEVNLFKMLAPPEMWSDEDDEYTGLWTRRPAFELALRRVAERQGSVTFACPASVAGITTDQPNGAPPRVTGLVLDDGTRIDADLVIDGAGRRTPIPKWLGELGVDVPYDVQDCPAAYYSRYYRLRPDSGHSPFELLTLRRQLDQVTLLSFTGDHDTFGLAAFASPDHDGLKVLRQDWAWDAFMGSVPRFDAWAHPDIATPLTGVDFMGGHQNILRHYVVDGRPLVHGMLAVGDSLCTTNPMYGWGASMALTYAFAAVEAAEAHPEDPESMALAYHDVVAEEAGTVYGESAVMDRIQAFRWAGKEPPEEPATIDRQELLQAVVAGATFHPALGRAQLRRMHLLPGWNDVLDDPEVVEQARNTQRILAAKASRDDGPTTEELLETVQAAAS